MRTIEFYKIPDKISQLEFDGDKTDYRLHHVDSFAWGCEDEKDYEDTEKKIDSFEILGNGYEVYLWCDISGFDYWIKNMKEQNYIQISVMFDNESINENELDQLKLDLVKALDFCEEISDRNCFDPFFNDEENN